MWEDNLKKFSLKIVKDDSIDFGFVFMCEYFKIFA